MLRIASEAVAGLRVNGEAVAGLRINGETLSFAAAGPVMWMFHPGGASPISTVSGFGAAGVTDTGVVIPETGTVTVTVTHGDSNRHAEVEFNPHMSDTVDAAALHALSTDIRHGNRPNTVQGSTDGIATNLRHFDRPSSAAYFGLDLADHLLILVVGDNGAWFSRGTVSIS